MKTLKTILLIIVIHNVSFSQCDDCEKALVKDYLKSNSSESSQLNILRIINKENYQEYKRESSSGFELDIPIVSGALGMSDDFEEFKVEREKLFNQYSYSSSEISAKDELKIVTNPVAYDHWSKCIAACYDNQENLSKVYGYLTYADSNTIFVTVKYKATSTSKDLINCYIFIENGMVLSEVNGEYSKSLTFSLKKNETIGFTINRASKFQNTVISISADGSNVFREVSKYSFQPPPSCDTKIGTTIKRERTKSLVEHYVGTNSSMAGGENISTNDDEALEVKAPCDGIYLLVAKGSYQNRAYTIVNVFLSIYTDNFRLVKAEQVGTNCNNFPSAEPLKGVITIDRIYLKAGQKVELRFGNSGSPQEPSQGFRYAAPGDFISLTLLQSQQ